jgi:hypothetical protein
MYNFKNTKAAVANAYLNPGIYKLRVTEVKQDKFSKGVPYIGIKFENQDGLSFIEKFQFGSEKSAEVSLSRLQYLHEGFFGKECKENFDSLEEITEYFSKYLTGKKIVKTIVVGGNLNGNVVYACLPYSGFIVPEGEDVELGEFDPKSKEYSDVVKKNSTVSEVAGKANGLLNDTEGTTTSDKKSPKTTGEKAVAADDGKPW